MVQQADCAIDNEHVSTANPTGCLHDLQSAITTTYDTPPGKTPHDTGSGGEGDKFAAGGSTKMFGYAGSVPARAGITSAR